jgi:hypothetical protein
MLLAWILTVAGWVLSWAINRWIEPVTPGGLAVLAAGTLVLAPATWWVMRAPEKSGRRVAYFSLVAVITSANMGFENPDLWILYSLLGLLRIVYRDSFLHFIATPLTLALYALVLVVNPAHALHLSTGQIIVRFFMLLCFHAISHVVHMHVSDFRPRPAKTAVRLLGQMMIWGLRRVMRGRPKRAAG